jgi:serine/threonine protein kinase
MSEPQPEAMPEQIGRYRVLRRLGAGAVGVVYAARDPELQRDVAVKLLRSGRTLGLGPPHERLRAEAQAMAQLAHPNVVSVFDVGTHGDSLFIAMELVDGMSLRQWIDADARTWREVMAMVLQSGRGLVAAHGAGIIHRDFKPANVLVSRDGRPRVVDFGLASSGPVQGRPWQASGDDLLETDPGGRRTTDIDATSGGRNRELSVTMDLSRTGHGVGAAGRETTDMLSTAQVLDLTGESLLGSIIDGDSTVQTGVTRSGRVAGTPAYMAPELFTGGRADQRTDQFAFAVTVYEGLFGERPFAGTTAVELVDNVVSGRIREAPSRTRVPGWVRDIVVRGLAVDPNARHESVRSMLAAFAFLSRVMLE